MINIQERNRKITNLIESVIRDHCRIYDTTLETTDDGIIVHYNENNCDKVFSEYKKIYGNKISFVCEDKKLKKYRHL